MSRVSHGIDRIAVNFDKPNLVTNAGLLLVGTPVSGLGLEKMINATVRLDGRVGGALPGPKVLTLVQSMVAGRSHLDHADVLRSGGTQRALPHRVMALDAGHVPAGLPFGVSPARSPRRPGTVSGLGPGRGARSEEAGSRCPPVAVLAPPAFLTDLDAKVADVEALHRHHAVIELVIRDLEGGCRARAEPRRTGVARNVRGVGYRYRP